MTSNVLILIIVASAEIFSVDVLYSEHTPYGEEKILQMLPQSKQIENLTFEFILIRIENFYTSWKGQINSEFLFDMSYDEGITMEISTFAISNKKLHFVLSQKQLFECPWSFYTKSKLDDYSQIIWNLMQHFEWDRSTISVQPSNLGDSLYEELRVQQGYTNLRFVYATEDRQSLMHQVSRLIKPTGAQIQIVAGDADTVAGYISAAMQKNIAGAGRALLIMGCMARSLEARSEAQETGLLLLTEEGTEQAGSEIEYDIGIINTTLVRLADIILQNDLGSHYSTSLIREQMIEQCYNSDQTPKASFMLLNSQNGVFKTVGIVKIDQITINDTISFLGGLKIPPTITGAMVFYTQNTSKEPTGLADPVATLNLIGYDIGSWEINLNPTILPNFQLQKQEVSLGQAIFDYDYARKGLESLEGHYGSAIFVGQISEVGSVYSLFEQVDMQLVVMTTRFASSLVSPTEFPRLNRLIYSAAWLSKAYLNLLKFFGWKQCALLHQDINDLNEISSSFRENSLYYGVDFVDDPELNGIPMNADYEFFAQGRGKNLLDKIIASKTSIIFVVCPLSDTIFYLLEYLYDRGFRRGDFTFIMTLFLEEFLALQETQPERYEKIHELAYNSYCVFQPVFVDEIGASFIGKSIGLFDSIPSPFSWLNYDSMFHLSYGLEFGISRGHDYEDGNILHKDMRQVRFTGCSGKISLEQNSNDRSLFELWVLQNFFNETTQEYTQQVVGSYSPISSTLFSFPNQIVWPDGTTKVPNDSRSQTNFDCPFNEDDLVTSHKGKQIMNIIWFSILALVNVLSAYMFIKYMRIWIVKLEERTSYWTSDLIIGATIPMEFFQYSSLGYKTDTLMGVYVILGKVLNSDLEKLIDPDGDIFWLIFYHCYGLVALWLVLISFQYLQIYRRWGFSLMEQTSYYLIPIVSNFFYIPIISILLSVLLWDETTGDDIDDAILMKDCHVGCWHDSHLIHSIASGFCLIVFVPTVVYMRPFIQARTADINVVTRPQYIIIKSVFQLLLIVMSKTLLRFDEFDYAMTYFFWLVAFTAILYFIKPYNYERFNLWQLLIICGNVWLQLLSILHEYNGYSLLQIRIALALGFFGLALCGFVLQKTVTKYRQWLDFPAMKNFREKVRFMCNPMSEQQIRWIFSRGQQRADSIEPEAADITHIPYQVNRIRPFKPLSESQDFENSEEILSPIAHDSIKQINLS